MVSHWTKRIHISRVNILCPCEEEVVNQDYIKTFNYAVAQRETEASQLPWSQTHSDPSSQTQDTCGHDG